MVSSILINYLLQGYKLMDKTLKNRLDKLTEQDLFMNEDVRLTYIENVVRKLKQGIFPTSNLTRLDSLIKRHNRIKEMKELT